MCVSLSSSGVPGYKTVFVMGITADRSVSLGSVVGWIAGSGRPRPSRSVGHVVVLYQSEPSDLFGCLRRSSGVTMATRILFIYLFLLFYLEFGSIMPLPARLMSTLLTLLRRLPDWLRRLRPHVETLRRVGTEVWRACRRRPRDEVDFNPTPHSPTIVVKEPTLRPPSSFVKHKKGKVEVPWGTVHHGRDVDHSKGGSPGIIGQTQCAVDGGRTIGPRGAFQQERFLTDPTLPDDVAVERVKPVGRKLRRAVKKLRQLTTSSSSGRDAQACRGEKTIPSARPGHAPGPHPRRA